MVLATVVNLTDVIRLELHGRPYREVKIMDWKLSASAHVVRSLVCTSHTSLPAPVQAVALGTTTSAMFRDARGYTYHHG